MSNTIILKNGTTTPDNTDLEIAEPGFKKNTGTLYIGNGDKVVQINPIISSEEPERIPGALWIDTSIESSTEDSPLPISQGGTGANNAADALVNLGAAPAGYGLGDSVWISDGRSANDMMSNGWFSWGSGGVVDVPFPTGYMFVVARQSGKHVTQFTLNANYIGTGNTQTAVRTYGTTGWSEWVNNSPSAFAPSGYGYGGQSVALKNNSLIANEDDLDNELAKIYDAMNAGETKMITFFGYPSNSDWRFFGILSKSSANNGSLIAHSAYSAGSKIIKQKYGGTWQPTEWENPPMVAGVEYRTTERFKGKVVYAKQISFGKLPASGSSSVSVGVDNRKVVSITGVFTDGSYCEPYPIIGGSGTIKCICWINPNGSLFAQANSDCSSYTGEFIIKYTKD